MATFSATASTSRRGSRASREPGGIAISASVREHIGNRLDLAFEDMGEQALKNIERPVRVVQHRPRRADHSTLAAPKAAVDAKSLRSRCFPFTNMSGDPEQEYFADGMTEDLITDLSKVSGLSVIARNSVFTYKGRAADMQEVSRRFHASHILEGSVRKAGQRVRINAQLIDGRDGTHLWADRYDRDLTDIFAIQDEITKTIVEQLKVHASAEGEAGDRNCADAKRRCVRLLSPGPALLSTCTHRRMSSIAQRWFKKALNSIPAMPAPMQASPIVAGFSTPTITRHVRRRYLRGKHEGGAARPGASRRGTPRTEWRSTISDAYPRRSWSLNARLRLDPNLFEAHYFYAYGGRDSR